MYDDYFPLLALALYRQRREASVFTCTEARGEVSASHHDR
jgi:hypothetical protein